jgi:hypothetical protein
MTGPLRRSAGVPHRQPPDSTPPGEAGQGFALPNLRRWLVAYLLADPVFALASARFGRVDRTDAPRDRPRYYLAVGVTLWTAWQLLTGGRPASGPVAASNGPRR